jgi:hypothetical protein
MNAPFTAQQMLERLRADQAAAPQSGPDLRWAHKILERHGRGERIRVATLEMARQAIARRGNS